MAESGWRDRIRLHEIYRYLGMKETEADERLRAVVEEQLKRLLSVVRVRSFYQIFPLSFREGTKMELGPMQINSRALARNLSGCDQAALFGMTLGLETDRLIYRLGRTAVGEAVVTDACAAAVAEAVCDELSQEIRKEAAALGRGTRPRFSPGFADFTLAYQRELLEALQLPKRIGVTLTGGGMMTPTKSVTAVVGLYDPAAAGPLGSGPLV